MNDPSRIIRGLAASVILVVSATAAGQPGRRHAPRDDGWPRTLHLGDTTVTLDAPAADALDGTRLRAHGGIAISRGDDGEPSRGTVRYAADVEIDHDRRVVSITSVEISDLEVEGLPRPRREHLAERLSQAATRRHFTLPLDDVLADIRFARVRPAAPPRLKNDPPRIVFATEPSILILFDGEPRFRGVEGTGLERAMNTPFLMLRDPGSNAYYLDGGTRWFRGTGPKGPWEPASNVPGAAQRIAAKDLEDGGVSDSDLQDARREEQKRAPKILVATEPTELIVSDGPPVWEPIVPGELDAITNSESDVFRSPRDGRYWLVLSGRWYRSDAYAGPWSWVEPDRLPPAFRRIPADSAKASVLAFVPGTAAAESAVAEAERPTTAAVRRRDAHVSVAWDGEPRFESIPGTRVAYALNSPEQVLAIGGRYYVCDQGVWFSAGRPTGPWSVADAIPDEDIAAIPPSSPAYNLRYAYVYDSTPDVVYVAYTPGYLWSYPYGGTVVFGTGWWYRPWWGAFYYPRPWTWGFHAVYAPWAGWRWGFGWGPAWAGWRFGFGWGWGARWCGPGAFFRPGIRAAAFARGVAVGRSMAPRNLYASGANLSRASVMTSRGGRIPSASVSRSAVPMRTAGSGAPSRPARVGGGARTPAGSAAPRKAKPMAKSAPRPGKVGGRKKP